MAAASKRVSLLLPHLDAAYNLARWLMRDEQDAKDVVQESYLRAFKFFGTWHGEADAKPWLLTIVRNSCYTSLRKGQSRQDVLEYDDELHGEPGRGDDPETLLLQKLDQAEAKSALERLPVVFREALILSELEGLSYKNIAEVTGVPVGTVMSRISRGRAKLRELLSPQKDSEDSK